MMKSAIEVFARLKPENNGIMTVNYEILRQPKKHLDKDFLIISARQKFMEYIDNRPESWNFSFRRIFDETIGQEDIFNDVARPVITSLFDGYNGTIFAYGQTGGGKTYTITGDSEKFDDYSGILPRTIHHVFEIIKNNSNNLYTVELSYLEIYNENGYDLLDQKQRELALRLEDLPHVEIHADEFGMMHLKNLGLHAVKNVNEAMNLLFIGNKNRMTSETPMNSHSSRSHCIFTIILSSKKFGCNHYSRTKMHLVDLAGSERVYKCAITGTILTEAKYINLSLHYLEQVIVCLGQENTSHVPYRNSLLTAILRDSLGGNCITNMLANLSISAFNLEETISTCRFAQRVALIRNDVKLVLRREVTTEIDLLKMENEQLRKHLDELNGYLEIQRREEKDLEYYENLVVHRDKKISLLMEMLNKEKKKNCKTVSDKMTETCNPKLSSIIKKCLVDIPSKIQNENIKNYSMGHFIKDDYFPLNDLDCDTKFDSNSLKESSPQCVDDYEKVDKELVDNNKIIIGYLPATADKQKSNPESPTKNFRTPRILRQLFGLEKKSSESLLIKSTKKKINDVLNHGELSNETKCPVECIKKSNK